MPSRKHCYNPRDNAECFQLFNGECLGLSRCYRKDGYSNGKGKIIPAIDKPGKHGGYHPRKEHRS